MNVKKQISCLSEFATPERFNLFNEVVKCRTRYFTVVLENIFQSHNASAVLRTCDCLGVQDVHVIEKGNTFKVSEDIALGASRWLNVKSYNSCSDVIKTLKGRGYRIVAASSHNDSCLLPDFDVEKGPAALLFGTELDGLSEELMAEADEFLKIPMYGFTESYNVSVSAALILYSIIEKIRETKLPYLLSETERDEIVLSWLMISVKDSEKILERCGLL